MGKRARNIYYAAGAALLTVLLFALFAGLASTLTPSFMARMQKKASSAPLFRTARKLGLTYEAALREPLAALGKPVLWCVHISSGQAYCGPGRNRPVDISNMEEMPAELYGRHSGDYECRNALLEITGVKTFDFGGARAVRPQAGFIDYR